MVGPRRQPSHRSPRRLDHGRLAGSTLGPMDDTTSSTPDSAAPDDPRPVLAAALDRIGSQDLPALAGAWTPDFAKELATAHLVLAEHGRGDLSHVIGPLLDRVPELAAYVAEDELLIGERLVTAERALEVVEGVVVAVHAADLLPAERRARLIAPWRRTREAAEPATG
jgi:hypothetical protein